MTEQEFLSIKKSFDDSLVKAVRDHAIANYDSDGWDYVVETFSDADISAVVKSARTVKAAIGMVKKDVRPLYEMRREMQAEAF